MENVQLTLHTLHMTCTIYIKTLQCRIASENFRNPLCDFMNSQPRSRIWREETEVTLTVAISLSRRRKTDATTSACAPFSKKFSRRSLVGGEGVGSVACSCRTHLIRSIVLISECYDWKTDLEFPIRMISHHEAVSSKRHLPFLEKDFCVDVPWGRIATNKLIFLEYCLICDRGDCGG